MPAEIINLRKARKTRARAEKDAKSAENRAQFGRSKAERKSQAAETARAHRALDGSRREDTDGSDRS